MTVRERIFAELKKRDIDQKVLATYINENEKTLSSWKNNNTLIIAANRLSKISDFFEWSLDYLLTGKEKNSSSEPLSEKEQKILKYFKELPHDEQQQLIGMAMLLQKQYKEQKKTIEEQYNTVPSKSSIIKMTTIKKYIYPVGAGDTPAPDSPDDYNNIEIPSEYVPYRANSLIRVNGESMEPTYPHGCYIWANMGIGDGRLEDFYNKAIIANDHGTLLLKIAKKDGLYSTNKKYKRIFADDSCTIIGVVIEVADDKVVEFIESKE